MCNLHVAWPVQTHSMCAPPPSSISGSASVGVLYTSILLQLPQRMVFPILLASLQRTQLAMEPSVMSLTSQMNYVSFTAVQSNIIHGSICSLQTKKSAVSLTSLCCDIALMQHIHVYLWTNHLYLLRTVEMLRTAILITYLLAKDSAQYSQSFQLVTPLILKLQDCCGTLWICAASL